MPFGFRVSLRIRRRSEGRDASPDQQRPAATSSDQGLAPAGRLRIVRAPSSECPIMATPARVLTFADLLRPMDGMRLVLPAGLLAWPSSAPLQPVAMASAGTAVVRRRLGA